MHKGAVYRMTKAFVIHEIFYAQDKQDRHTFSSKPPICVLLYSPSALAVGVCVAQSAWSDSHRAIPTSIYNFFFLQY